MVQARRGKPRLYKTLGRYDSDLWAMPPPDFGRMHYPAGYCFWYSENLGTVESVSATSSANLYNEKSLKPHLKH
jgi:hypothetical protein